MIRNDITVDWTVSPRIITILAPSANVSMQDLYDTLRWLENDPANMDNDSIVSGSGKENLGGGVFVGLTVTLKNAQLAFENRPGPTFVQCNATGGNLVAVDINGDIMEPIYPTSYTQVILTSSSSATIQELSAIQYASYNNGVTIDAVNGTNSAEYPFGTPAYPCKTTANSYAIRQARGFSTIYLKSDLVLTGIPDGVLSNLKVIGITGFADTAKTLTIDNILAAGCEANNLVITGSFKPGSVVKAKDCTIENVSNVHLHASNCFIFSGQYEDTELEGCQIEGDIRIAENGIMSGVGIVFNGDFTTIDMQGKPCTVSLDIDSGYFQLLNSSEGCLAEFNLRGGEIELNPSCTGGEFYAEGYGTLFGDPSELGMTIKANHLIALETIPKPIWETNLTTFNDPSTAAYSLWNTPKKVVSKVLPFLFAK